MSDKAKKGGASGLGLRVAAAAVLIPVVVFLTWKGGLWFAGFVAVMGIFMALEWVAMAHDGRTLQKIIHIAAALIATFGFYAGNFGLVLLVLATCWLASLVCFSGKKIQIWQLIGVAYVSLPLLALVLLRAHETFGLIAIFLIFAMVWSADTLAYFAGRTFGGPKLWPSVSPNKTWSGFFGAVFGGVIGAMAVMYFAGLPGIWAVGFLGAAIGGLEQGGDLLESALKRNFGFKDSGAVIPGHGGVLDRVDGLVAAAAAAFIFGVIRAGFDNSAAGLVSW